MTVPPRSFIPPLNFRTPITDPATGAPTLQFIQLWQKLFGNVDNADADLTTIQAEINALEAAKVPPGGSTGQVLTKNSPTSYDMSWQPGGGGGGGGGGGAFSGALVYRTTDLTAQDYSAGAVINWQAEEYDTDNWFTVGTSASRIVVPAGVTKVRLGGQVRLDLVATTASVSLAILKNGVSVWAGVPRAISTADSVLTNIVNVAGSPVDVVAGDYFELRVQVFGDTSVTFTAAGSWFAVEAVGVGGGAGGIWAPMVTGDLPGPQLIATGDGQCVMAQIG